MTGAPKPAQATAVPQSSPQTDRSSASDRRTRMKRMSGRVLVFMLAAATTAVISAYASTKVANVYADKAQSRTIKTALGTQLSVASVRAYDAAVAVAAETARRARAAQLLVDRNNVISDWTGVAAAIDVSVYAHFSGTGAAKDWRRFESAVDNLANLSYVVRDTDRAWWANRVHDYLASSGVQAPSPPPTASRDPWIVLGCTEPGCVESGEWLADFTWAGLWLIHARQRLILDFFRSAVQNPA